MKHGLIKIAQDILESNPALMESIIEEVIDNSFIERCEKCGAWEHVSMLRSQGENAMYLCQHCE